MIQRIQSLWLLAAAVCSFLTLKFEFYAGTNIEKHPAVLNGLSSIVFTILTAAIGVAALITIFLYKQRKLQIRISSICFAAAVLLITLYFLKLKNFTAGTISLWSVFYFAIPVLLILAMRGIWKDEKLIKSMDKLR
jgi:phosphatidylserine synthase